MVNTMLMLELMRGFFIFMLYQAMPNASSYFEPFYKRHDVELALETG